jgi:DNA modification methylase
MDGSFTRFDKEVRYEVKNGETLKFLKKTEAGRFDLVVTSPPYNIGKKYETKTSIEKYLETQENAAGNEQRRSLLRGRGVQRYAPRPE